MEFVKKESVNTNATLPHALLQIIWNAEMTTNVNHNHHHAPITAIRVYSVILLKLKESVTLMAHVPRIAQDARRIPVRALAPTRMVRAESVGMNRQGSVS